MVGPVVGPGAEIVHVDGLDADPGPNGAVTVHMDGSDQGASDAGGSDRGESDRDDRARARDVCRVVAPDDLRG